MVIQEWCPQGKASRYKKNGQIHNNKQNHQCYDCSHQFVQGFEQYLLSADEKRALMGRLLLDGSWSATRKSAIVLKTLALCLKQST